jgi:hypothetical protein
VRAWLADPHNLIGRWMGRLFATSRTALSLRASKRSVRAIDANDSASSVRELGASPVQLLAKLTKFPHGLVGAEVPGLGDQGPDFVA